MSNQGGAYFLKSRHRNCPHATWIVQSVQSRTKMEPVTGPTMIVQFLHWSTCTYGKGRRVRPAPTAKQQTLSTTYLRGVVQNMHSTIFKIANVKRCTIDLRGNLDQCFPSLGSKHKVCPVNFLLFCDTRCRHVIFSILKIVLFLYIFGAV